MIGLVHSPSVPDRAVLVEDVLIGHMRRVVYRDAPIPSAASTLLPWWLSRASEASALARRVCSELLARPRRPVVAEVVTTAHPAIPANSVYWCLGLKVVPPDITS